MGGQKVATSSTMDRLNKIPTNVQMIIAIVIIYFCYGRSAYVQERIVTHKFINNEGEEEKFVFTFFILFFQCVAAMITSKLVIIIFQLPANTAPPSKYITVSATFILAQFFSVHALLYVSYPTQVLAKSCKPIPVMLLGLLILGKKYTVAKYAFVTMMCVGLVLFSYNPNKASGDATSMLGYILLGSSLLLDGVTGNLQEKLVKQYSPTSNQLMFFSNAWACLLLLIALIFTGELWEGLAFCQRHPSVYPDLVWFGLCNAIGQHAVYYLVRNYGALVLSTATTTRKFFTILLSVILFGHPVTLIQWCGVFLVFASLSLDIVWKQMVPSPLPTAYPQTSSPK